MRLHLLSSKQSHWTFALGDQILSFDCNRLQGRFIEHTAAKHSDRHNHTKSRFCKIRHMIRSHQHDSNQMSQTNSRAFHCNDHQGQCVDGDLATLNLMIVPPRLNGVINCLTLPQLERLNPKQINSSAQDRAQAHSRLRNVVFAVTIALTTKLLDQGQRFNSLRFQLSTINFVDCRDRELVSEKHMPRMKMGWAIC